MNNKIKGIFLALLATIGAGIYSIPYRLSLDFSNPLPVIWGVFLWALFFSLPGAWFSRHKINFSWKIGFIMLTVSLVGLIGNFSVCKALTQDSPTLLIIITRSEIIITMLLSWIFLKELISIRIWLAVLAIIIGIIVMKIDSLNFEMNDWSPFLWSILAAFSFSAMLILTKIVIHEVDPQVLNVFRLFLALIILWNFKEVRQGVSNFKIYDWQLLSLSAFFGPFLGRLAYTYSIRYLTVSKAVIICSFAPVITFLFELIIFGTMINWYESFGGIIILIGIIFVFLPRKNAKKVLFKEKI